MTTTFTPDGKAAIKGTFLDVIVILGHFGQLSVELSLHLTEVCRTGQMGDDPWLLFFVCRVK